VTSNRKSENAYSLGEHKVLNLIPIQFEMTETGFSEDARPQQEQQEEEHE